MAKMLGVFSFVVNQDRAASDNLQLRVGGTIMLTNAEMVTLSSQPDQLLKVKVKVLDSDTFDDDLVFTDESFSIAALSNFQPFSLDVIVPAGNLRSSEPSTESFAEIYCRIEARRGNLVKTNASSSKEVDVRIR